MPVTGAVLLLFIVFHILDLTTGTRPIGAADYEEATRSQSYAYDNLVASFERPLSLPSTYSRWRFSLCTWHTDCGAPSMISE